MQREMPSVGKALRACFPQEIRSIDEKSRTIEFVASTEAVDRYGDVIRVAGWKYQNYLKNPVFLWGHRSGDPPIGKCVDLKVESKPPALVQKIEFADAATYPFADTIFNLYKGGFLRAVSVGFMPTEQPMPMKDADGFTTGWEFNGQELLELSAVPIPANPEAVARARTKNFTELDLARVFLSSDDYVFLDASQYAEWESIKRDVDVVVRDTRILNLKRGLADAVALLKALTRGATSRTPKESRKSPEIITTLDDLADVFKPSEKSTDAEIATVADLADVITESAIVSRTGSRKWRDVR